METSQAPASEAEDYSFGSGHLSSPINNSSTAAIAAHRAATITRKPVASQSITVAPVYEKATLSSQPPLRESALSRLWHRSSLRARVIAIVATGAVLALIIGLAAGLSARSAAATDLPLPSAHGGPYTGDLTYYAPGLGACGVTSADGDSIVAVSYITFDAAQTGTDPNTNPLCGRKMRVKKKGGDVSVDLTVVDRCTGCAARDLDLTEDTFAELADVSLGRVVGEWSWL